MSSEDDNTRLDFENCNDVDHIPSFNKDTNENPSQ